MAEHSRQPLYRIVIVGGGAGGLPLATSLGDKLGGKNGGQSALDVIRLYIRHPSPVVEPPQSGRSDLNSTILILRLAGGGEEVFCAGIARHDATVPVLP